VRRCAPGYDWLRRGKLERGTQYGQ